MTNIRKILEKNFLNRQISNPMYSLRAYSRHLDISPGALSQILSGQRSISKRTLEKIYQNLDLNSSEIKTLNNALEDHCPNETITVDMNKFHLIDDWYYFAILSLAKTKGFSDKPEWIAQRLNISVANARKAMKNLCELGILEKKYGRYSRSKKSFQTSDGVNDLRIQKRHRQHLDLALRSLQQDNVADRDFTSVSMAIDPEKLPQAKKLIRKYIDRLCKTLETGEKKEVYLWCQQLFPLTKLNSKEK